MQMPYSILSIFRPSILFVDSKSIVQNLSFSHLTGLLITNYFLLDIVSSRPPS